VLARPPGVVDMHASAVRRTVPGLVRSLARLVAAVALLLPALFLNVPEADASFQVRGFSPRFSVNAQGAITLVGNTLASCSSAAAGCAQARNATAAPASSNNNNSWTMAYVDVDGDSSTINSSSATLSLPAGSSVLFAELTWGGESTSAQRGVASFRVPGAGYVAVSATRVDVDTAANRYSAVADVTPLVAGLTNPNGTYWVGNVQSTVGATDKYAAWALVVVYENLSLPLRNLVVFDGYSVVNTTAPSSISTTVSGFLTPALGTVHTEIGSVVFEGDVGYAGDSMSLNGTTLSNALNPANNFFNSSITIDGVRFSAKNPDYVNQMAFDADIVNADGILGNSATSATFTYSTTQDVYYPTVVTFQTDVFTPSVDVVKSSQDITHSEAVYNGDTIRYTLCARSSGNDPATFVVLTDPISPNVTYVPGSTTIDGIAKTDAAGDDQVDFSGNVLVIRLGTGADATSGGTLAPGDLTTIQFDVTVNDGLPAGTSISNQAQVVFSGATLGGGYGASSDSSSTSAGDNPDTLVTNAPPVAVADTAATLINTPVTVSVLDNDWDPDGNIDPTTVSIVTPPAHGSITAVDPVGGAVTYAPTSGYVGPDVFRYRVCDTVGQCAEADVSVTVSTTSLNPPTARPDGATTPEQTAVTIDVLANDSAGTGAALVPATTTVIVPPANGTTSVDGATGAITYTPTGYFYGSDPFVYQVCDNHGLCDSAVVSVDVTRVDHPPIARDDNATVAQGSSVTINVLANDTDPENNILVSSVAVASGPAHGSATVNANGTITYTPAAGYFGPDSLTYTVCDTTVPARLCSSAATVTIGVGQAAPAASDDAYAVHKNRSFSAPAPGVLGNDTDPNGLTLSAVLVAGPVNGTLSLNADGSFSYDPVNGYKGPDTFTYIACTPSPGLCSPPATVTLTVSNDRPEAPDDAYGVAEDGDLAVAAPGVMANDSDPNGDPLTSSLASAPVHGALTLNTDGSFAYTPDGGYSGSDSFSYLACDTDAECAAANVVITITALPGLPVANGDAVFAVPGLAVAIDVLGNDAPGSGSWDLTTLEIISGPTGGTASVNADGTITYSTAGGTGSDSFQYRVCNDSPGDCTTATVQVTIDRAPAFGAGVDGSTIGLIVGGSLPGPVDVSDPDSGDTVTVSVSGALPDGVTLSADGTWSGSTAAAAEGSYPITITACDQYSVCSTANVTIVVSAAEESDPPAPAPTGTPVSTPPPTVVDAPEGTGKPDGGLWLFMVGMALALVGVLAGWSRMEQRRTRGR
jgi:uncharacterized repeat protein (TIGR01451 family)